MKKILLALSLLSYSTFNFAQSMEDNGRLTVSILKNSNRNFVTIPEDQLTLLCGDEDGCMVRLSMNNFGANPFNIAPASISSMLFINTLSRQWRTSEPSAQRGTFGNNVIEHALSLFNTCYLTDGYFKGSTPSGDKSLGMSLMFWPLSESAGCSVTIID